MPDSEDVLAASKPPVLVNPSEDQTRFQSLIEQHRGIVQKIAAAYGRRKEDREDLAQEICLQLWKAFPAYDKARRFTTWMYRIALNVAISYARSEGVRTRTAQLDSDLAQAIPAPIRDPADGDHVRALMQFVEGVDELNRAVLLLYLEERSYREIAEVLGITETNVATKISRLKQRIREELV